MWHGGGTYLSSFDLLLEIIHADIGPDIPRKINQNAVDSLDGIAVGCQMIIMLNLGRWVGAFQPQNPFNKCMTKGMPVVVWVGCMVCIETASCTTKFCRKGDAVQAVNLCIKATDKHGPFLP